MTTNTTCRFCHATDTETHTFRSLVAGGSSTLCVDSNACGVRWNVQLARDEARWALEDEAQWAREDAEQAAEDAWEDAVNEAMPLPY